MKNKLIKIISIIAIILMTFTLMPTTTKVSAYSISDYSTAPYTVGGILDLDSYLNSLYSKDLPFYCVTFNDSSTPMFYIYYPSTFGSNLNLIGTDISSTPGNVNIAYGYNSNLQSVGSYGSSWTPTETYIGGGSLATMTNFKRFWNKLGGTSSLVNNYVPPLSLKSPVPITLPLNFPLNKSSLINTVYGENTLTQTEIDALEIISSDPTVINSSGTVLKQGTADIQLKVPDASASLVKGTTQSITVNVVAPVIGGDVTVTFDQPNTLELIVMASSFDFGGVTGLSTEELLGIDLRVKSSLPYDLNVRATNDFHNKVIPTASVIKTNKLGISFDAGGLSKLGSKNTFKNLVTNAPDTSAQVGVFKMHTLGFDLSETVGYKAGDYELPLEIVAIQK